MSEDAPRHIEVPGTDTAFLSTVEADLWFNTGTRCLSYME